MLKQFKMQQVLVITNIKNIEDNERFYVFSVRSILVKPSTCIGV